MELPKIDEIKGIYEQEKKMQKLEKDKKIILLRDKILSVASEKIQLDAKKGYTYIGHQQEDYFSEKEKKLTEAWVEAAKEINKQGYKADVNYQFNSNYISYLYISWH